MHFAGLRYIQGTDLKERRMRLKVFTIIISLCTLIFLGLIYGWSIFVVPLENEFGWSRSETSLTFTISIMAMCLSILTGVMFNGKKDKPLISMIISASLIAAGFILTSQADSLMGFYICYGVLCCESATKTVIDVINSLCKGFTINANADFIVDFSNCLPNLFYF